jgi:leader peptidase (prepilin peptidase) / N-methyltransferase
MDPMVANWRVLLCVGALTGGAIGSFLNVVAYRLPRGKPVTHPPSACPHCGHGIRPWHNIPVFGWLMLRGRCHDCGEPIAPRYPAVEALCAAMWALLFWDLMPSPSALTEPEQLAPFFAYGLYFSALLAISLVDLDHFIVPDSISLPLVPLGVGTVALLDHYGLSRVSFPDSVLGAVVGGGSMLALALVGRLIYGREALGMGDVKLMAAIGAWQGLHPALLLTVFGGSLLGSVVGIGSIAARGRDRQAKLPFGPFLCGAALIAWVWGDVIMGIILPTP